MNLEVTLSGTRDGHSSNPFGSGELGVALKRVFNKVLVFLASFLNDEESPQTKFEALPYPLKWLVKSFPDCIENQDQDRGVILNSMTVNDFELNYGRCSGYLYIGVLRWVVHSSMTSE